MFGKINDYQIKSNTVIIEFEKRDVSIEIINPYIINFFSKINTNRRNSKAIENLKVDNCEFKVNKFVDYIEIKTEDLVVKIYNNFKVDIFNKFGNIICEDYRGKRDPFIKNCAGRLDLSLIHI